MAKSLLLNRQSKAPAEDTAAFGAIAERFRRAGALEQAVSLCREGLQKFPDHVSARVTLGWSLLDLGKYDEARIELEQVMRRAPDNLAAIRGLAELHDRFEHTLNLPMDGPGQWPPPAESVESDIVEAAELLVEAPELAALDEEVAASLDQFEARPQVIDEPVVDIADVEASEPEIVWAPPPAAAEPVESPAGATGMSSVREIDPFAGVVSLAQATEPAAFEDAPIELTAGDLGVSDPTLAALIAEAESLEAAAELVVDQPAAFEAVAVDDDPIPAFEIAAATIEPATEAGLNLDDLIQEEVLAEMVAEPAPMAEVIPFEPAAVVDIASVAATSAATERQSRNAAVLKKLEQMLVRVQARRLELMAESVA